MVDWFTDLFSAPLSFGKIADLIASILSFKAPLASAMLQAGVSKSTILRTVACAWELLELSPCAFAENRCMALAVIHAGVKFEWTDSAQKENALKLLAGMIEKKRILSLERQLVNMLWSSR